MIHHSLEAAQSYVELELFYQHFLSLKYLQQLLRIEKTVK